VAGFAGRHGVPALQSAGTDRKIVEGDGHAFGGRLRADPANQFGCNVCDRIDRHGCFQFNEESGIVFVAMIERRGQVYKRI